MRGIGRLGWVARVGLGVCVGLACLVGFTLHHDATAPAEAANATVVRPRFLFIQDTSGSMTQTPVQVPLSQSTDFPLHCTCRKTGCTCAPAPEAESCSNNPGGTTACKTGAACANQTQCAAGWNCSPTTHLCQTCCDANGITLDGFQMSEVCSIPTGMTTGACWFADGAATHGDGSVEQPGCDENGNGLYDDAKLYQAKGALQDIIAGYPEVEFALERYHTVDNKTMATACGGNKCSTYLDCPNDPDVASKIWTCNNPTNGTCTGVCENCAQNGLTDNPADSVWGVNSVGECGKSFSCAGTPPANDFSGAAAYQSQCADWGVDKTCDSDASPLVAGRTVTCAAGANATGPLYSNDTNWCINYVGTLHSTATTGNTCVNALQAGFPSYAAGGDVLVPFSLTTDTANQINAWINNSEADGEELRASAATPIEGSLLTAKSYFLDTVNGPLTSDPSIPCRSYSVIFLTDGAETCDTNAAGPANAAAALRNLTIPRATDVACTAPPACTAGQVCWQGTCRTLTNQSISTTAGTVACADPCGAADACTVAAGKTTATCQAVVDVKTYVIGFNLCPAGGDTCPDANALDGIAVAGGTTQAFVAQNQLDIETAVSTIVSGSIKPELCNGVDDNCNGLVDEGYNVYKTDGVPSSGPNPCGNGMIGACAASGDVTCVPPAIDPTRTSTYCSAPICAADCRYAAAICSLIDKAPPAVCPTAENCMNGDADCDGVITASCPPGCSNPQPEVCDGQDQNCNGKTDECCDSLLPGSNVCAAGSASCQSFGPGGGATCGSNIGVCKPGQVECCTPGREGPVATTSANAVAPGVGVAMIVANGSGIEPGLYLTVDTGPNQEVVVVSTISGANFPATGPTGFTATFTKAHGAGVAVTGKNNCTSSTLGTPVCVGGVGPTAPVESNNKGQFCNCLDDDCNGVTDENITEECYPSGATGCVSDGMGGYTCKGTCQPGTAVCSDSSASGSCVASFGTCQGAIVPAAEARCSGVDTNCDGVVSGPIPETCNGQDDDCDGVIDNPPAGGWGDCYPSGTPGCTPDPTSPTGYDCAGSCHAGTDECIGGTLVCVGAQGPQKETCNGTDDDCDGHVDCVGLSTCTLPGVGIPCATAASACPGMTACMETSSGSAQIVCTATGMGTAGAPCYPPSTGGCTPDPASPTGYDCLGICKPGQMTCASGSVVCVGAVTPGTEVCNGLDNNCDGIIPQNAICPSASDKCIMGLGCVAPCTPELGCPLGYTCTPVAGGGSYCESAKCANVTCPPGQNCDGQTGQCVDPCANVTCPTGDKCVGGSCENCSILGCPKGQLCQSGVCTNDPCYMKTCPSGQMCQEPSGDCVGSCQGVSCPSGQICMNGACVADLCTGVTCSFGQSCDPATGKCVQDPCSNALCAPPTTCVNGTCVQNPCNTFLCKDHYKCVTNDMTGQPACEACTTADETDGAGSCTPPVPATEVLSTGGGGCTCNAGGPGNGPSGSFVLGFLVLAGLGALRTRRRLRAALRATRRQAGS
jgi:hypothetical protein